MLLDGSHYDVNTISAIKLRKLIFEQKNILINLPDLPDKILILWGNVSQCHTHMFVHIWADNPNS